MQIESGVSLILYEGRFSNEDFATAVASVGKTGRFIMFPEHAGTIGNAWGGTWDCSLFVVIVVTVLHVLASDYCACIILINTEYHVVL